MRSASSAHQTSLVLVEPTAVSPTVTRDLFSRVCVDIIKS